MGMCHDAKRGCLLRSPSNIKLVSDAEVVSLQSPRLRGGGAPRDMSQLQEWIRQLEGRLTDDGLLEVAALAPSSLQSTDEEEVDIIATTVRYRKALIEDRGYKLIQEFAMLLQTAIDNKIYSFRFDVYVTFVGCLGLAKPILQEE